jgi:hypothetical protein
MTTAAVVVMLGSRRDAAIAIAGRRQRGEGAQLMGDAWQIDRQRSMRHADRRASGRNQRQKRRRRNAKTRVKSGVMGDRSRIGSD